ncbi:MAG: 16S rRNA (cytosine(967)-C(5))-methyltransferase RsmB [Ruminococcaceae bacterium]|nr:16S rRNA (cytosine(967)-C(5))-methyltransferase RsmB [Oscillospiraceae bacterium]
MTARSLALDVLNKCTLSEQYSNIALDTALRRCDLNAADRALVTALVYGVLERGITLDYQIDSLYTRKDRELQPDTRNLLRLGLFQLAYLDRIPDHAAVNETVALAPRRTKGLVNAVLRSFLRRNKELLYPDASREPIEYLSIRYSFLPAICRRFLKDYGFARTESLLSAFCVQPPLTLRVNTLRITKEELLRQLTAAGYTPKNTAESSVGLTLSGASVTTLPGFEEGWFFVQDEASQLCVAALDARAGMRVLDACACPGSKSFGAAIDMNNHGKLIACDLHANKLSLIQSGAGRLGISIIETEARDARLAKEEWNGTFDRVLCDVPCSGFGVFAKKPELRYKDPEKSAALPKIQLDILNNAAAFVKQGGRLVYSTCTLLPAENGANVRTFLETHRDFTLLCERTLYPDTDATDGFYFAVLQKN